ncbi:MAG: DUF1735 domain-containing protein, partial [Bacteroidales bacterium]
MIRKYKAGFVALAFLGALSGFTSCDEEKDQYLDEYATILYFNNAGEVLQTLYKTGGNTTYKVVVNKAGSNLKANAEVTAQLMSQASLSIYNEMIGTDYVILPSSCFNMDDKKVLSFTSEESYKSLGVEFYTDEIYKLDKSINYVLPLELIN